MMPTTKTVSCHSRPPSPPLKALGSFLWEVMLPSISYFATSSAPVRHPCVKAMNEAALSLEHSAPPSMRLRDTYLSIILVI